MGRLKNMIYTYGIGKKMMTDSFHNAGLEKNRLESQKGSTRTEVINYLVSLFDHPTTYLEIGIRNPNDNFNSINATVKYGVDPGIEYEPNPVDFKMTSDDFFQQLAANKILSNEIKFDVIFIDGLHTAEQVNLDIANALRFINDDGFVVLHDCNPPTEWHAREKYDYTMSPAGGYWNGTTWKAFLKSRFDKSIYSCCVDTDWGIGILSKKRNLGDAIEPVNQFYEFSVLESDRKQHMNLIDFTSLKQKLGS